MIKALGRLILARSKPGLAGGPTHTGPRGGAAGGGGSEKKVI